MVINLITSAALGENKGSDFGFCFRPDTATGLKPLDEASVAHGQVAEAVRGKAGFLQERLYFGYEVLSHGGKLHALACKSTHAITFKRLLG